MTVLVTGAGGFLGQHVVAALLRRGHQVRAMVRPATDVERIGWHKRVEIFRADLRNSRNLPEAFGGVDTLIHLAAAVQGELEAQLAGSVATTERLLGAMAGSSTRHLVFVSSFSVYDWSRLRRRLDEDSPLEADLYDRDAYAIAKTWQERVVRRHAEQHRWDLTVLRPGLIWGPGHPFLPRIGQSFGRIHLIFGVTNRLPLTYVANCADCTLAAIEKTQARGRTYNVTDGTDLTSWRLMREHMRRAGSGGVRVPVPYSLASLFVRTGHWMGRLAFGPQVKLPSLLVPSRFEARFKPVHVDRTRLAEELQWQPPIAFEEAMDQTYGRLDSAVPARPLLQGEVAHG